MDSEEADVGVVERGEHLVGDVVVRDRTRSGARSFGGKASCLFAVLPLGQRVVMMTDQLDDPAVAGGRVGDIVGVHELLVGGVELIVEPLCLEVGPPDRLDRVDVDPQLFDRVLRLRGVGIEVVLPHRVRENSC